MKHLLALLALCTLHAQTSIQSGAAPIPYQRPPMPATPASDALPAQTIGPDDLISIMVSDCPELSRSFRVSSDGTLALPLLGHRIPAAGLLPVELEDKLAAELAAAQILVQPIVSVSVTEYRSKPVSVVGAVKSPLTFQAMSDSTLLDAIAKAGGIAPEAGPELLITRKDSSPIQHVNLRKLMEGDQSLNVHLHGGEEVRIPEIGKIFVTGNVKMPGAFLMQDNSDTTLMKALALSQGTLPYSQKLAYIYRKDPVTNKRTEIPAELRQIMKRKSPDIELLADDIVYIPEASGKKLAASAIDRIAGTGQSVVTALSYRGY